MEQILRYQRVLTAITIGAAAVIAVALLVIFREHWHYSAGIIWGIIGGIIGFRWKVQAVLKFMESPQTPPVKNGFLQIVLMFFFLAVAAVINRFWGIPTLGREVLGLWAVLVGLVLPNIVLMADGMIRPTALSQLLQPAETSAQVASEASNTGAVNEKKAADKNLEIAEKQS